MPVRYASKICQQDMPARYASKLLRNPSPHFMSSRRRRDPTRFQHDIPVKHVANIFPLIFFFDNEVIIEINYFLFQKQII
jgi:hypothetical protein